MSSSRIVELANLIQQNTGVVDKYLQNKGLPSPSFDEDGLADFDFEPEAAQARTTALEATWELRDLLLGPTDNIRSALLPANCFSLQAIAEWDVASKVPLNGEISYKELAEKCGQDESRFHRILRFAMVSHRVFKESRKGYVAHSATSRKLAEDKILVAHMGFETDECWRALAHAVPALEKYKNSDEPTETGWCLGQGSDVPLWEFYETHPKNAQRFKTAMEGFDNLLDTPQKVLVEGYPWATVGDNGSGTVVDMGGCRGNISACIAESFPNLKFIVQDFAEQMKGAKEALPEAVRDCIDFKVHNFFDEQPVQADAFLFRYIFHNWADSKVLKILRALVPALRPGAKVIINDFMIPEPGSLGTSQERSVRHMDLIMLALYNSREREKGDWEMLFREAHPRFTNIRVWVPTNSVMALIEATWE